MPFDTGSTEQESRCDQKRKLFHKANIYNTINND